MFSSVGVIGFSRMERRYTSMLIRRYTSYVDTWVYVDGRRRSQFRTASIEPIEMCLDHSFLEFLPSSKLPWQRKSGLGLTFSYPCDPQPGLGQCHEANKKHLPSPVNQKDF